MNVACNGVEHEAGLSDGVQDGTFGSILGSCMTSVRCCRRTQTHENKSSYNLKSKNANLGCKHNCTYARMITWKPALNL